MEQTVLRWVVGIGMAASLVFAYTSTNGFGSFGAGAAAVLPALLALAAGRLTAAGKREWIALVVIALVAGGGLFFEWHVSYRDVPPLEQTARVESGPYSGLFTTPSTAATLVQEQADLRAIVRPGDRLLSYDRMPAAYLMTDAMPAAPMLWTAPLEQRSARTFKQFKRFLDLPGHAPTIAVRNDRPAEVDYYPNGLVDQYVRERMTVLLVRPEYRLLRLR
jgi:hypothetical protein